MESTGLCLSVFFSLPHLEMLILELEKQSCDRCQTDVIMFIIERPSV